MKRKKRIAIILAGGTISEYKDSLSGGIFSFETKEQLSQFLPDLEENYRYSLFTNITKNKYFMTLSDWENIYTLVRKKYKHFDGFVIAQESDSLLFGSALLSYMLAECKKPVIFLASPCPFGTMGVLGKSAENELMNAIHFAASDLGEVCIYDNNLLHRAIRSNRKNLLDSSSFYSYQTDPLGKYEEGKISLFLHREHKDIEKENYPYIFPQEKILFLRMFPGCSFQFLQPMLQQEKTRCIVIETLGYGSLSEDQVSILTKVALSGVWLVLLAKHDSSERGFPMDCDMLNIPNMVLLQNTTVWSSFAKAHIAMQNIDNFTDFSKYMKTSFNGDIVE